MARPPKPKAPETTGKHVHGPDCAHDHQHEATIATYQRETPKLGRNDPCSCGSGKKFKKCHGANL